MNIRIIKITPATVLKVFDKHNVLQEEIEQALRNGRPRIRTAGAEQYVAIGKAKDRHLTIFFRYDASTKEAEITTAYPSSEKQIKAYKKR